MLNGVIYEIIVKLMVDSIDVRKYMYNQNIINLVYLLLINEICCYKT